MLLKNHDIACTYKDVKDVSIFDIQTAVCSDLISNMREVVEKYG
jgi:hypothetical protein